MNGFEPDVKIIKHDDDGSWEERLYSCVKCCVPIGRVCYSHYIFGHSTLLKTNKFPHYCPNCGLLQNYEELDLPKSFF